MTYNYSDISLGEYPGEISLILYSGSCINQCPWCFNTELLNKKPLSFKQMKDAIDEHQDFVTAVVFSGGEPLNNPFFIKGVRYAKDKGLKIKVNTSGLVHQSLSDNVFVPHVDYINISLKGLPMNYDQLLKSSNVYSQILNCDTLEYSFVYSSTLWSPSNLKKFQTFLKNKISYDWRTMFSNRWSQPDIFTLSQMQVGNCLDSRYNQYSVPTEQECINIAWSFFSDIPKEQLIVETKEFGRKRINI